MCIPTAIEVLNFVHRLYDAHLSLVDFDETIVVLGNVFDTVTVVGHDATPECDDGNETDAEVVVQGVPVILIRL